MRFLWFLICVLFIFSVPSTLYAVGIEIGVGAWSQSPKGEVSYKKKVSVADSLDLERDLRYDTEIRPTGRLKIDMPLSIPNIYLMATPMSFEGDGSKTVNFNFGNQNFTGDRLFYSKVTLDHLDAALYYGLPILKKVTGGKLNAELGVNVRIVEFKVEISQPTTGLRESKELTLYIPMGYVGVQVKPIKRLAVEAEARGIGYGGNHYYSLIGRLKVKVAGPLFLAGGFRHDEIKIDAKDIVGSIKINGPFAELGLIF